MALLRHGQEAERGFSFEVEVINGHRWNGRDLKGFYTPSALFSAQDNQVEQVIRLPDTIVWAGTDITPLLAVMHRADDPRIGVFTNRPRPERKINRSHPPAKTEIGGVTLASEIMLYDHIKSCSPTVVSRAIGGTAADHEFRVEATDTGDTARLIASLTYNIPILASGGLIGAKEMVEPQLI